MTANLVITELFQQAWKQTKAHIWILAGLYVGFSLLYSLFSLLTTPISQSIVGSIVINLILIYFSSLFSLGYLQNIVQALDDIEPQLSAYKQPVRKVLHFFLGSLLFALIFCIGLCIFVLPGIYIALRLQFFSMYILEKDMNAIEALKQSWQLTRNHAIPLLLLALTQISITLVGILLLIIGIFVAIPLVYAMYIVAYRQLTANQPD